MAQPTQTDLPTPGQPPPDHGDVGHGAGFWSRASLLIAVVAAGFLLGLPDPATQVPQVPNRDRAGSQPLAAVPPLAQLWPQARIEVMPGPLLDATGYLPWHYLDARTSMGTAQSTDRSMMRLLLRSAGDGATTDPAVTELRRLSTTLAPQFLGFVSTGDEVYWIETTIVPAAEGTPVEPGVGGVPEASIWRYRRGSTTLPEQVTTELGDVLLSDTQNDLVIADGRLRWAAVARDDANVTELRSVPLAGGVVEIDRVDGAYLPSSWPWLTSASTEQAPFHLFNPRTGERKVVPASATELISCTPVWCRSMVLGPDGGPTRIDLMRPDGSARQRVAGPRVSTPIAQVAMLDRFEVLTRGNDRPDSATQLLIYDTTSQRTAMLAEQAGMIFANAGILWWSTGESDPAQWHALDLRTLA